MAFDLSENMRHKMATAVKTQKGCEDDSDVFDCLSKFSAEEIVSTIQLPTYIVPVADGDFFSEETTDSLNYQLAHRLVRKQLSSLKYFASSKKRKRRTNKK